MNCVVVNVEKSTIANILFIMSYSNIISKQKKRVICTGFPNNINNLIDDIGIIIFFFEMLNLYINKEKSLQYENS